MDSAVNSNPYWDQRFNTDWEGNAGRQQTQFFAHVALELMPAWLSRDIRRDKLTMCDWGCAEGDATDVLASYYATSVTGVDFALPGIELARGYYPDRDFLHANFLEEDHGERYDIVFSSNTLEHFTDPFATLDVVARRAKNYVVLLLPFQEFERINEHFATFDYSNIPFAPAGFSLVHGRVTDTGAMTPNYWPGKQVLLVYARTELVSGLNLTFADVRFDHVEHALAVSTVRRLEQEAASMRESAATLVQEAASRASERDHLMSEIRLRDARVEALGAEAREREQSLAQRAAEIAALQAKHADAQLVIDGLRNDLMRLDEERAKNELLMRSHSWRLTRPLRVLRRWFSR